MTSKEKLEALNYIWFYEPTCQEDVDKREAIIKELVKYLEILEDLKEILSMDYLVSVCGFGMAKRLQTYLKSNDIVKEWLDGRENINQR